MAKKSNVSRAALSMRLHSLCKSRNNAATFRRFVVMSEHYHDADDLKLMRDMRKLAPDDFNAWLGLNNIVGRDNGAIPKKYRELIAIAVSCATQCPYCLEAHAKAAQGPARRAKKWSKRRSSPPLCAPAARPRTAPWRSNSSISRRSQKKSKIVLRDRPNLEDSAEESRRGCHRHAAFFVRRQ
jgi:AhpD family alkylhydroperoxidase